MFQRCFWIYISWIRCYEQFHIPKPIFSNDILFSSYLLIFIIISEAVFIGSLNGYIRSPSEKKNSRLCCQQSQICIALLNAFYLRDSPLQNLYYGCFPINFGSKIVYGGVTSLYLHWKSCMTTGVGHYRLHIPNAWSLSYSHPHKLPGDSFITCLWDILEMAPSPIL